MKYKGFRPTVKIWS